MEDLIKKFKREEVGLEVITDEVRWAYHRKIHNGRSNNKPTWRGRVMLKLPTDICLYAETIYEKKPDFIVELGTRFGASALFFADMMEINGKGKVITVDIQDYEKFPQLTHPRVEYIVGNSVDRNIVDRIRDKVSGEVMVVLDSAHFWNHVYRELRLYRDIVTKGQYMVVEDCWAQDVKKYGPARAIEKFLPNNKDFVNVIEIPEKYIFSVTRDGWLLKV